MDYKRILTIQDISCVGQCSLTVALPILSACGIETAILPSAVLSTHTAGFSGYTFRDLTEDMPAIMNHWKKEGILFDAFYTGYLGSTQQIDYIKEIFGSLGKPGAVKIVDPAMADNGNLYPAFDRDFVAAMRPLCAEADIILPNITEACFLADVPYIEKPDEESVEALFRALSSICSGKIVLTGVGYREGKTGVAVYDNGIIRHYEHDWIEPGCHGTGDVYASAFTGAYVRNPDLFNAAKTAADFTVKCIEATVDDKNHWYGVKFEKALPYLDKALNG
ncbi:MAG: pyridoxamine kinase [Eubacterium sp.]|nr:pyridoxamine kinase [Eubacterium sp.]